MYLATESLADAIVTSKSPPPSMAGRLLVVTYYITTPIYYANDAPHLGHTNSTVIADALARWHRMLGEDVYFLTGTDEHGLKMQRAAEEQGLSPQELSDQTSRRYREAWNAMDITNDRFIRTTDSDHTQGVQALLQKVYDAGDIELRTYEGLYCVACEAYYAEDEAPSGECPTHLRPLERMQEENYFFKLSRYEDRILKWIDANPECIIPRVRKNEVLGFLKGGLKDISISRKSLKWGIPLPFDTEHVTWVWFDALPNYLTGIGYGYNNINVEKWWPSAHHIVGKDILRFHAVFWPAMLMSAGIEPPQQIAVTGWWLVGGEKMSKTRLNQISPIDLAKEFGSDAIRYYLLREVNFGNDGDISHEQLTLRYNTDLANNLGNLLARVATVVQKKCGGVGTPPTVESPVRHAAIDAVNTSIAAWEGVRPSEALESVWALIRETNAMLEQAEPWKADPGPAVDAVMGNALEALRITAILIAPVLPRAAAEIWHRIGMSGEVAEQRIPRDTEWGKYPGGHSVEKGDPLFPRR